MREPWLSGAAGEMLLGYELVPQRSDPRRDQAGPRALLRLWNARYGKGLGKNKRQTNSIPLRYNKKLQIKNSSQLAAREESLPVYQCTVYSLDGEDRSPSYRRDVTLS